jgi:hypothetical protein
VVAGLGLLLFLFYLLQVLGFDMFRSDVRSYWLQSFEWRSPFNAWWVPGYSLVIALARGVSFGRLPPIAILCTVSGIAYLVAVTTVYRIARQARAQRAFELAVLFGLFPLVGLTYVAYPISDMVAMAVFLLAVLEMQRERWGWFTLWSAAAMLCHKVMWFFVPPLLVTVLVQHPRARRVTPLAVVPLLLWIVGGALRFHSLLWFIRFNYETHAALKHGAPVLAAGLIETLADGSPAKLGKGVVILTTLAAALVTAWRCVRDRQWAGLSIAAVVAFLVIAVNAYEIWIAVRFGKLLVVCWCLLAPSEGRDSRPPWAGLALAAGLLLASNLAFGYYLAHYFFHETTFLH